MCTLTSIEAPARLLEGWAAVWEVRQEGRSSDLCCLA